jgi:hypothetical protein
MAHVNIAHKTILIMMDRMMRVMPGCRIKTQLAIRLSVKQVDLAMRRMMNFKYIFWLEMQVHGVRENT